MTVAHRHTLYWFHIVIREKASTRARSEFPLTQNINIATVGWYNRWKDWNNFTNLQFVTLNSFVQALLSSYFRHLVIALLCYRFPFSPTQTHKWNSLLFCRSRSILVKLTMHFISKWNMITIQISWAYLTIGKQKYEMQLKTIWLVFQLLLIVFVIGCCSIFAHFVLHKF